MSTDVPAFDCRDCGTRARTDLVDYDALGYAVCPVCGRSAAPASEPIRSSGGGECDAPSSLAVQAFEWGDAR